MRLPGKESSNSHGARPIHQIISILKWIHTSSLSLKYYFSLGRRGFPTVLHFMTFLFLDLLICPDCLTCLTVLYMSSSDSGTCRADSRRSSGSGKRRRVPGPDSSPDCRTCPGCIIFHDCLIFPYCSIRPDCLICPDCLVYPDCLKCLTFLYVLTVLDA